MARTDRRCPTYLRLGHVGHRQRAQAQLTGYAVALGCDEARDFLRFAVTHFDLDQGGLRRRTLNRYEYVRFDGQETAQSTI